MRGTFPRPPGSPGTAVPASGPAPPEGLHVDSAGLKGEKAAGGRESRAGWAPIPRRPLPGAAAPWTGSRAPSAPSPGGRAPRRSLPLRPIRARLLGGKPREAVLRRGWRPRPPGPLGCPSPALRPRPTRAPGGLRREVPAPPSRLRAAPAVSRASTRARGSGRSASPGGGGRHRRACADLRPGGAREGARGLGGGGGRRAWAGAAPVCPFRGARGSARSPRGACSRDLLASRRGVAAGTRPPAGLGALRALPSAAGTGNCGCLDARGFPGWGVRGCPGRVASDPRALEGQRPHSRPVKQGWRQNVKHVQGLTKEIERFSNLSSIQMLTVP